MSSWVCNGIKLTRASHLSKHQRPNNAPVGLQGPARRQGPWKIECIGKKDQGRPVLKHLFKTLWRNIANGKWQHRQVQATRIQNGSEPHSGRLQFDTQRGLCARTPTKTLETKHLGTCTTAIDIMRSLGTASAPSAVASVFWKRPTLARQSGCSFGCFSKSRKVWICGRSPSTSLLLNLSCSSPLTAQTDPRKRMRGQQASG